MTLGKTLSRLRRARRLTQEQLAEALQVSHQSVSRWERDAAMPETAKLLSLCKLYGCSLDELFGVHTAKPTQQNPSYTESIPGASCLHINVCDRKGRDVMLFDSVTPAMYGVYHGKDATIAVTRDFCVAFLRLTGDHILSVLHIPGQGAAAVVDGHGVGWKNARSGWCYFTQEHYYCNAATEKEAAELRGLLDERNGDALSLDGTVLTYRMADAVSFECRLSETICMDDFETPIAADAYTDVTERMRAWNRGCFCIIEPKKVHVFLAMKHNNFIFLISDPDSVYCRAGQNGYCSRGWAMRSSTCLRANECRMLEDNLEALDPYQPMKEAFVENSCAFPSDGGWYWSIREANDDVIRFNGCSGDIYTIFRPQ